MARPGTQILLRETAPARGAPTDTGVWFAAGPAEKGRHDEAVLVRSMSEFTELFGSRLSYSYLADSVETFFKEGGNRVYIGRVVGPAAASASIMLDDAGAADTLQVQANGSGDWGNALNVQVAAGSAGGTFVLVISHDTLGEVERSPDLADKTAAFAWAEASEWITLVDQASANDPAVAASASMTGGTDDHDNIVEANWANALALFVKDLGPGQVSMPGRTTNQAHTNLLAHTLSHNRVALLDAPDTGSKSTLVATAIGLRSIDGSRFGSLWAPWAIIPGVVAGTTRTVPYSAVEAGMIARNDVIHTPNVPSAGDLGQAQYAIGLSQPRWSDSDAEDLNEAGVDLARMIYGGVRSYGYRSLTNPLTDRNWIMFNNSRLFMYIATQADVIAERFVFEEIDGKGITLARFGGELTAMLMPLYNAGSLFGVNPDDAFIVDVGPGVNTLQSIADGQIKAVISVKMSPFAEMVTIEIVKSVITEGVL